MNDIIAQATTNTMSQCNHKLNQQVNVFSIGFVPINMSLFSTSQGNWLSSANSQQTDIIWPKNQHASEYKTEEYKAYASVYILHIYTGYNNSVSYRNL